MVIVVQNISRHWRVVHPSWERSRNFICGKEAFDAAAVLALAHHGHTGTAVTVQVAAFGTVVEAPRFG